jgi:hypothetical protein
MEHAERVDDGHGDAQRLGGRQRAIRQTRRERLTIHQLHHDVRLFVPLTELEDLADQRM